LREMKRMLAVLRRRHRCWEEEMKTVEMGIWG
jgi:hypothetical protein